MRPDLEARLADPRFRRIAYAACCAALIPVVLFFFSRNGFNYVNSDGKMYYVYLPSWILDGDLDFENEIRARWGNELGEGTLDDITPTGLIRNKYPIGLALTLSFPFAATHGAVIAVNALTGAEWSTDGYGAPYQLTCVAFVLLLGAATMMLLDELLTDFFRLPGWLAFAAILSYVAGSATSYYFFREPFMVHIVSTFWCTAMVVLAIRAGRTAPGRGRLWLHLEIGFCLGMALACRPTNVVFAALLLPLLVGSYRQYGLRSLLYAIPLLVAAVPPVALQAGAWDILFGQPFFYSYQGEGFDWGTPRFWHTLFSSRHGLFTWHPLLLLAAFGIIVGLRRADPARSFLLACWVIAFLALWYLNSAWHMWWFGGSFGGRAFLEMTGLFVIGLAFAYRRIVESPSPRVRALTVAFVGICLAWNAVLIYLYGYSIIDRDGFLF